MACRVDPVCVREHGESQLVPAYLYDRLAAGDSPSTLATTRSGLRMFHRPAHAPEDREDRVRALGAEVALPRRTRAGTTRSRGPVAMDADLARDRYPALIEFCRVTGLRRRELATLTAADVHLGDEGGLAVRVRHGKGGRQRIVPVLPGREAAVRGHSGQGTR